MTLQIIEQMVARCTRSEPTSDDHETPSVDRQSVDLYSCEDCSATYIKNDMATCPSCEEPVESTPTFDDLGISVGRGR